MTPFLKWPGGKRQILPLLKEHVPKSYNRYFEPFVGAGSMVLELSPNQATINDVNLQLLNVYTQIRDHATDLVSRLEELDSFYCDDEFYLERRKEFNIKIQNQELDVECAALMIWINKHCFNGLYRVNSKGLFNVSFNGKTGIQSADPENIKQISSYLNKPGVHIYSGDFEEACESVRAGDFVYFDPPYLPDDTGDFTAYAKDGFYLKDHERLMNLFIRLDKLGAYVMQSNRDVDLIYDMYSGFHIESFGVRRNISCDASKRTGREVLITNFK